MEHDPHGHDESDRPGSTPDEPFPAPAPEPPASPASPAHVRLQPPVPYAVPRPASPATSGRTPFPSAPRPRRPGAGLGGFGAIGAFLILLLGKAKTLLVALKFLKLGTLVSMVVSIGAYSLLFGWPFAVGFVLLIFVHELGHAIAMGQMGIRASAPVFIPFVGAVIAMRGRPRDAFVEAVVGIGGPLLGSLGAVLCLVAAVATGSPLLYALASTGFFLNLFNMLPLSPLDGGRIAGAISRWLWVIGFALAVGAFVLTWNPMLLLILLLGVLQLLRLRSHPVPGYYDIVPWKRALIGAGYFGLIALLAFATQVADAALAATGHRVALMHAAAAAAGLLLARAGR